MLYYTRFTRLVLIINFSPNYHPGDRMIRVLIIQGGKQSSKKIILGRFINFSVFSLSHK